jgi:DNA polymerase
MQSVTIDPTFSSWRDAARRLLGAGVAPGEVLWADGSEGESLFATGQGASPPDFAPLPEPATTVPPAFMDLARNVAAHTDARRWPVLYTVLWRLTRGGERHLLNHIDVSSLPRIGGSRWHQPASEQFGDSTAAAAKLR